MQSATSGSWLVRFAGLALSILLAACGGGGGGGSTGGGGGSSSNDIGARMSSSSVLVERDVYERRSAAPTRFSLEVSNAPGTGYYYRVAHTTRAILTVGVAVRGNDAGIDFDVIFAAPGTLPAGSYDDAFTIELCLDPACARPVQNSPLRVDFRLVVGHFAATEPGMTPLALASSTTLAHDVIDAAYSPALDALVMVSAVPAPSLHLRYLASGQTRSVTLAKTPTALALSPDGLRAAVGHDALVSLVELLPAGSASTLSATTFAIAIPVGELVLDAQGRVLAFGNAVFNWNALMLLDSGTGATSLLDSFATYGPTNATLHPSGTRFYYANRGLSPDDIFVIGIDGSTPSAKRDSPYHGEYAMCGRVWVHAGGSRLFTACGNTFTSSVSAAQDMNYAGAMALSGTPGEYEALSLSSSAASGDIVLLEQSRQVCDPRLDALYGCFTRLSVYNGSSLSNTARYTLAPVTVGAERFAQIGRLVFHRTNGQVMILTELRGAPAASSIRLSALP
jgi:hypothetical protein